MSSPQEQLISDIQEIQAKFSAQVYEPGSELYFARHLVGPKSGFKLIQQCKSKNHYFPWVDGQYAPGIDIGGDGNEVHFKFQPPAEEDDEAHTKYCTIEDMVQFLSFYFEYLTSTEKGVGEYGMIHSKLREIQFLLISRLVSEVRSKTTQPLVQEAIQKAQKAAAELQKEEESKGKAKISEVSE